MCVLASKSSCAARMRFGSGGGRSPWRSLGFTLLFGMLLCSGIDFYGAQVSLCAQQTSALKGQVNAFGDLSDAVQLKMGIKCGRGQHGNLVVREVRPAKAAAQGGIHKFDLILAAKLDGNALVLTLERGGRIFKVRLRELNAGQRAPVLLAEKAKMDFVPSKPFNLSAEQSVIKNDRLMSETGAQSDPSSKEIDMEASGFSLEAKKNLQLLAHYNLELMVDRSMSMRKPDCPGGLSRWEWCGAQAADLARALDPYVPNGLTLIPFATEYDVFEHATAKHIDYLFNNIGLQFGTRLFEPLAERLDNYFAHHSANTKPLLIVVITDGVPFPRFEPALVRNELIEASEKMTSSSEVTVIFCQIGERDRFGQQYLQDLDENLVGYGARYHFVHTIPFDQLQEMGLGQTLVACIKEYTPPKLSSRAR